LKEIGKEKLDEHNLRQNYQKKKKVWKKKSKYIHQFQAKAELT
jgi:hypothetical protein